MLIDSGISQLLESSAPDPSQVSLEKAWKGANRVTVSAQDFNFESALGRGTLVEEIRPSAIEQLRHAMAINEDARFGHCLCVGDLGVEFWRGQERLLLLGLHHGIALRCSLWKWDARLQQSEPLLDWLATRGVTYPLEQYLADRQRGEESRRQWQRWLQSAPPLLAAHPELLQGQMAVFDWDALRELLDQTAPLPKQRAPILFAWFGSGSGPWSGFPSYETVPEHFLEEMEISLLVQALTRKSLPSPTWVGAARYFAGWSPKKNRAKTLSAELKARLLQAVRDHVSNDHAADILSRATRAFT